MTKEEILKKYVSLYFSSHHDKSRWNGEGEHGGAEWHTDKAIAEDIYKAMNEYASINSIEFIKWHTNKQQEYMRILNSHVAIDSQKMSEMKEFEYATIEKRYELFIQQTENK